MLVPREMLADAGARVLWRQEMLEGGYEWATRQFFEANLAPGDLFLDVGAHWGVF